MTFLRHGPSFTMITHLRLGSELLITACSHLLVPRSPLRPCGGTSRSGARATHPAATLPVLLAVERSPLLPESWPLQESGARLRAVPAPPRQSPGERGGRGL